MKLNTYPVMCELEHYICALITTEESRKAVQKKIDRMKVELDENGEDIISDDLEDLATENGWRLQWLGGDSTMIMW